MTNGQQYDPAAINAATGIESLVSRYVTLKRVGAEFVGPCVWHAPDDHPSMYVVPEKNFVHCFACGEHADAIGFLQQVESIDFKEACRRLTNGSGASLPPANVTPRPALKKPPDRRTWPVQGVPVPDMRLSAFGPPVKTWTYRTADGAGIYGFVARYEGEGGKKEIRCWSWGNRSDADPKRWECGHFGKPRPLYGLDRLASFPDKQVMVVEGEKAADAASLLLPNMVCVTWPGGAGAVRYADWTPLAGRSVVIWPDADDAGKEAATHLVTALRKAEAGRIKVLAVDTITVNGNDVPTPQGWDAADAKASAWTREETWAWARKRVGPDLLVVAAPQQESTPETVPNNLPPPVTAPPPSRPEPQAAPEVPSPPPASPATVTPIRPANRTGTKPAAVRRPAPTPPPTEGNAVPKPDPEDDYLPPAYSQDALAVALVDAVGEDWRYTATQNQWYHWSGSTWNPEKTLFIFDEARALARLSSNSPELSASLRRELASRSTAASMVAMSSWDRRVATPIEAWNVNKGLLGTPGGVVDLKTGMLIQAAREQLITMSTTVMPEPVSPSSSPTLWLACLQHWCGGDRSLIDYLQRLCGYCLTGETREQMLAFVHGPARAGKTTIIKHIAEIMGDYACNVEMESLTESKHERHSSELARLRGKRLVYAAETEEGRRWAEARIKKLSGEDRITARNLYENPEEFMPEFKLIVYGNHAPHLRSPDAAIARRLHIIPFVNPVSEEQRDLQLDVKLRAEHGRILAWMVAGALAWYDAGLGVPEAVTEAVTKYMDAEDTFGDWLNESLERTAAGRERSADLYQSYRTFIEGRGEAPVSQKRFAPKLEERGFVRVKTNGIRMFEGGKLRAPALPPTDYGSRRGD